MKKNHVLCNRLREYRKKFGLSQAQLGYISGLSQNSISSIEKGDNNLSVFNALKLANILNCSVEDLFSLPEEELYY